MWALLHGVDDAEVKRASDVPAQISIEDTYRGLNEPAEVEAALRRLEAHIRDRDLAEKRRVAPGWLDSDARLLEPERKFSGSAGGGAGGIGSAFEVADSDAEIEATSRRIAEMNVSPELEGVSEMPAVDEGAELDRAFGLK